MRGAIRGPTCIGELTSAVQRLKRERSRGTADFAVGRQPQLQDTLSARPARRDVKSRAEDHRSAPDRGAKAARVKAMASKRPIGPAGPPKDDTKQNAATAAGGAQGVPAPAQRSAAF